MSHLIKLSVSKSSTFQSCKAKYKYSYIDKLPKKDWQHHHFGRFVHRILELFHLMYIEGTDKQFNIAMGEAFNTAYTEYKEKLSLADKEEAYNIILIYLKKIENNFNIKNILAVEKPFNLQISEDVLLTGMVDRFQCDDDGVFHIVDYKTSKSKMYLQNDILQLLTYAYVIYNEYPQIKKVRASYIMLRHNCEFITKEFTLEQILSIKDKYITYAKEMLSEEEFAPNPTILCKWCDFLNVCPEGKKIANKDLKVGKINWIKGKSK